MEKIERTLGEGLIAFREDLGMTRKEFYEKAGISKVRLSQLENNKSSYSEKSITAVLDHFNVSFPEFAFKYCGITVDISSVQIRRLKDSLSLHDVDDAIRTLTIIREIIREQK